MSPRIIRTGESPSQVHTGSPISILYRGELPSMIYTDILGFEFVPGGSYGFGDGPFGDTPFGGA